MKRGDIVRDKWEGRIGVVREVCEKASPGYVLLDGPFAEVDLGRATVQKIPLAELEVLGNTNLARLLNHQDALFRARLFLADLKGRGRVRVSIEGVQEALEERHE